MKSGANFADRNRLKQFVKVSLDNDEEIDIDLVSKKMRIQPDVIETWVNHYLKEFGAIAETEEDAD